jgi:hypothetical protein
MSGRRTGWKVPAVALLGLAALLVAPVGAQGESGLSVGDHGVGTSVENRELVGRGDRFAEGSTVVFFTEVLGGSEGDRILHVWIREGDEQLSVGLSVGGPRWRTHSRKTLHPGSAGAWAVEARDQDGQVLARAEFTCVKGG